MNIDPVWIQAIFMIILVIITAFYAKFTRDVVEESKKTRESMWQLEIEKWKEERKKELKRIEIKKMAIRRLISGELSLNIVPLENLMDKLKELNKTEIRETLQTELPEITTYEAIISDLGILGEEEVISVIYSYRILKEIKMNYREIIKLVSMDMNENKKILDDLLRHIKFVIPDAIHHCYGVVEIYEKLFKGKIDEKEFEELLKETY